MMLSLFKKKKNVACCTAVIVAAGSSSRMNGTDKIMADLGGKPVVYYAIRAFDMNPFIAEIVVVTRQELLAPIAQLCSDHGFSKVRAVVLGGETRVHSVLNGARQARFEWIAVHDAARPLVPQRVITDAVKKAVEFGAAAPAIPVKDTVKMADNGAVTATPPREKLVAVQTPQVFDADLLRAALEQALKDGAPVTDDCSAVERIGMRVFLSEGAEENFKITTPSDWKLVKVWMEDERCESDTATTYTALPRAER